LECCASESGVGVTGTPDKAVDVLIDARARLSKGESYFVALDLLAEVESLRSRLTAHHDLATLSDEVIREYDFRECPVCRRALVSGESVRSRRGEATR
jgi:hypothetical protein